MDGITGLLDCETETHSLVDWHIITGEFPPDLGGVSDYTWEVARGLAQAGHNVFVWVPGTVSSTSLIEEITVHRRANLFSPRGLFHFERELNACQRPRRILLQYVPQAFGLSGANLPFAAWILGRRLLHGDAIDVMVHEVWIDFDRRSLKRSVMACMQRAMAMLITLAAQRIFVSIPEWSQRLDQVGGRRRRIRWLPVPSTVPLVPRQPEPSLLGHLGTYNSLVQSLLTPLLHKLLCSSPGIRILLMGRGSEAYLQELLQSDPALVGRIECTGSLPPTSLAQQIARCRAVLQPYPDGISSRRTSAMAALQLGVPLITNIGYHSEPFWVSSSAIQIMDLFSDSVASLIQNLLDDSAACARMSHTGQALYAQRFALEHTIDALVRL